LQLCENRPPRLLSQRLTHNATSPSLGRTIHAGEGIYSAGERPAKAPRFLRQSAPPRALPALRPASRPRPPHTGRALRAAAPPRAPPPPSAPPRTAAPGRTRASPPQGREAG